MMSEHARPPHRSAQKMLVLDFSGTLSLGAVSFASEANLIRRLKASGLWGLGLTHPDIFWQEIVNPTWAEGSTTTKGYKRLMFDRVKEIAQGSNREAPDAVIWRAVSHFVDDYFKASTIEPVWKEPLEQFLALPNTVTVIATDHYAEATAHIMAELKKIGIASSPAFQATTGPGILVANSADAGYPKAHPAFWRKIRRLQRLFPLSKIAIIDDFGSNEQSADPYADPSTVEARQVQTVQMLVSVFRAHTAAFPFFLHGIREGEPSTSDALSEQCREAIRRATDFVLATLIEETKAGT